MTENGKEVVLEIGDKYINQHGAINPTPMELVEITETDYIFMDGMSPWGGKKEDVHKMIEEGIVRKAERGY